MLKIKNLKVKVEGKEILKGISLSVQPGEVVAVMGPNGSGKSTMAFTLMGHPFYEIVGGKIEIEGQEINEKTPDERARMGLFLAVQYPVSIPGVTVREALLAALRSKQTLEGGDPKSISALTLKKQIEEEARDLLIDGGLLKRSLNDGFSGGEKKKMEILQMRILKPKYAILDETDSGLDIDALKIVAEGAATAARDNKIGVLVITHYQRLLKYLKPDRVVIMKGGEVVDNGGAELVEQLEKDGYKKYE